MSNFPRSFITLDDSPSADAFGRLRVSNPVSRLDTQNQYNKSPLFWDEGVAGGGTSTHIPDRSTVEMDVGTDSGDKVTRQTHCYIRYQPGKSQMILASFIFDTQKANLSQRVGYFDDENGIFFEDDGSDLKFVRRTFTDGSAVNNDVTQANWNIDKLDGTGDSKITIDTTKAQILFIDLEALYVGRVRIGFQIDGLTFYAHEFNNANVLAVPYMTTPNLPLRYEIENTGVVASASTLQQICSVVSSEGGFEEERGLTFSGDMSNATATVLVATAQAFITVRPRLLFNGIVNRGLVVPSGFDLLVLGNNPVHWDIILGGTLGGGPSFTDVDTTHSIAEVSTTIATVTGGRVIDSGYASTSKNVGTQKLQEVKTKLFQCLDMTGTVQDELSLVLHGITGNSAASSGLRWKELY